MKERGKGVKGESDWGPYPFIHLNKVPEFRDENTSERGEREARGGPSGVENDEVVTGEGSAIETDGGALRNRLVRRFEEDLFGVIEQETDGVDFGVGDDDRFFVPEDAVEDRFVLKNGDTTDFIDLGEQISGHGGFLDFLPAVAPFHLGLDERAEHSVSCVFQAFFGLLFVTGLAVVGAPNSFAHGVDVRFQGLRFWGLS